MACRSQFPSVVIAAIALCGSTLLLFAKPLELEPLRPAETPVDADYGVEFDRAVALFESRVAERERDFLSRIKLGGLYVQKAKRSEDGTYFDKAEQQYEAALALCPADVEAKLGLVSVAMANHHFEKALQLAEEVWQNHPDQISALAMMGDAQLELGEYAAAAEAFESISRAMMTAPVQARLSRLAEIEGRPDEAIQLMQQAWDQVRDLPATGRDKAWYVQRLGELMLSHGRCDDARGLFLEARRLDPTSSHAVTFLGHTAARTGRYKDAESLYWQALELTNDAGLYAALGDLRQVQGHADEAAAYYDRAEELWDHSPPRHADHHASHFHAHGSHDHHHRPARLPGEPEQRSTGRATHSHSHSNPDAHARTLSTFLSDHDRDPERALALAQTNLQSRRDIYSYDALAWALYRNGQLEPARAASEQALKQGTRDAALWYHAGLIHAALGERALAVQCLGEVQAINPGFSLLHSGPARRTMELLRTESAAERDS